MIATDTARELASGWLANDTPELTKLAVGHQLDDIDWPTLVNEINDNRAWVNGQDAVFKVSAANQELDMLAEYANAKAKYHSTFCRVYSSNRCDCREAT